MRLRMSGLLALRDYGMFSAAVAVTGDILVAAFIGSLLIKSALRRLSLSIQPRLRVPSEAMVLLTRVLGSLLWLCAGLLVLDVWGVGVAGVWAVLASAAAVVGVGFLAVWTIVSNITASLFIGIWHRSAWAISEPLFEETRSRTLGGRRSDARMRTSAIWQLQECSLSSKDGEFVLDLGDIALVRFATVWQG